MVVKNSRLHSRFRIPIKSIVKSETSVPINKNQDKLSLVIAAMETDFLFQSTAVEILH
ncbi:unnamed protein product [Acanthoscelides obtectus]|uniref:Uncharacterized protein n=1 Tax=Acanthoscelides obtectus TaxID=200917 RepID=A0A9P0PCZ8_ACAOB|nr:unnamed protein product [Acanthoscelides obtectus]CAK1682069.1 hypothetical protein AOBTE_LOCUS33409 [Acanthoscelides obtectus]